jgi:hypothetical protein
MRAMQPAPQWSTWREALGVMLYRPHLRKTVRVALLVGTILFLINQFVVVLRANWRPGASVWIRSALTYLVPFGVSNYGILVATRRRMPPT